MKKIFSGEIDDEVHSAFLKFGRGEYKDKYLVDAKKQKDKFAIKTSAEFTNFLVRKSLEGKGTVAIKGIIVSTVDLKDEMPFPIVKSSNFQGVRKIQIDTEVEASDILALMEKYPRFHYGLSFKVEGIELKVKPKPPKSPKGPKPGEEAKADFCTLKTSDETIMKEILFDVDSFKEVKINHTLMIDQILYPNDSSLGPKEIREMSKRKGKIIRKTVVDGNEVISEAEFVA